MNRQNTWLLVLIAVSVSIIGIVLAHVAYYEIYFLDEEIIDIKFKVSAPGTIGFDLNDTVLSFGKVPQGQLANRNVIIHSRVPAKVMLTVHPPISTWITPSENPVILESGEQKTISMLLTVPSSALIGNYTGTMAVTYLRLLPWEH
ncbi:hypothetical protein GOV11_04365 [Candidatus Woesearchaeota archaeon]|nr:hypothetical protein [Candidatus Woesearchaeota archaeon]